MNIKNTMKLLHIGNWLGMGGAEKLLAESLPLYREQGIDVELLLTTDIDTPLRKSLEKKIKIHTLPFRSYYDVRIFIKLIPFLKRYDLIHVHLFPPLYFVALAKILSGAKTPLVFTEHSTSNRRFTKKRFRLIDKWIYNTYAKIISITDEVNRAVINHTGIAAEKTRVIQNGINLEKFISAVPLNKSTINSELQEDDFVIMQVSSFQYPKDQPTVIKSLLHLPEKVILILVGDGVDRLNSENLVRDLGLSHRVLFLGIRTDIPSLLKTADVVVLSSRYEGLSLSSIEGMASGKPFIASDVPGLTETVKDAGILFPQGDDHKLAEEIMKLMEDKEYYDRVAASCVQRAANYDINVMVDKTIELYKSVLKEVK